MWLFVKDIIRDAKDIWYKMVYIYVHLMPLVCLVPMWGDDGSEFGEVP